MPNSKDRALPYSTLDDLGGGGRLLLQFSLVALLASYLCTSLYSADFYWHLALGQWIHRSGGLPSGNFWTLIAEDLPWFDAHWLFQLCLAEIENAFGEYGLLFFKLATCLLLLIVLGRVFVIWASDSFVALLVLLIVGCGLLNNVAFTPEIWGWMFFAIFCDSLYRARYGATQGYFFFVVSIIGVLSANIHPVLLVCALSVPFGLLLPAPGDARLYKELLLLTILLVLVSFCSPYAGSQIPALLRSFRFYAVRELWDGAHPGTIYDFSVCFLILQSALVGTLWYAAPKTLAIREAVLAALVAAVGFASTYLTPYALIYLGFLFCLMWSKSYDGRRGNLGIAIEALQQKLARLPAFGTIVVLLCAVFANTAKLYRQPSVSGLFPEREIDYLIENKSLAPVYHPIDIGGYTVYRFSALPYSDYKAALAPQVASLLPELSRLARKVDTLQPNWQQYFNSILAPYAAVVRYDTAIYSYLREHPNWRLVFQNGQQWPPKEPGGPKPGMFSWALFLRD